MKVNDVVSKGVINQVILDKDIELPSNIWIRNGYAMVWSGEEQIRLHRYITNAPRNMTVDHINRNQLDNRKENLRLATYKQQARNKVHKGYYYDKNRRGYIAKIKVDDKRIYLGIYDKPDEAGEVYRTAHVKYFGEFSPYYKEVN